MAQGKRGPGHCGHRTGAGQLMAQCARGPGHCGCRETPAAAGPRSVCALLLLVGQLEENCMNAQEGVATTYPTELAPATTASHCSRPPPAGPLPAAPESALPRPADPLRPHTSQQQVKRRYQSSQRERGPGPGPGDGDPEETGVACGSHTEAGSRAQLMRPLSLLWVTQVKRPHQK